MEYEKIIKPAFTVIGMEGSTEDGDGFIAKLWSEANSRFDEVAPLAKRNAAGSLAGIWGAMSDMSMQFLPWQNGFTQGKYLAGVECRGDAMPPEGWQRWNVPGYEYLRVLNDGGNTFADMLDFMSENGLELAGAVHDYTDPATGKGYMYFPIRKLEE